MKKKEEKITRMTEILYAIVICYFMWKVTVSGQKLILKMYKLLLDCINII